MKHHVSVRAWSSVTNFLKCWGNGVNQAICKPHIRNVIACLCVCRCVVKHDKKESFSSKEKAQLACFTV